MKHRAFYIIIPVLMLCHSSISTIAWLLSTLHSFLRAGAHIFAWKFSIGNVWIDKRKDKRMGIDYKPILDLISVNRRKECGGGG